VINGCLDISSCEAGDRRFKLVGGLQKLKNGNQPTTRFFMLVCIAYLALG
jgi:hypothetical protein